MKKSLAPASFVFVFACAVALVAWLAVYASFDALNLPVFFGVFFGASLLLLAFGDYARKPRFRARGTSNSTAHATTPAKTPAIDAASAWTYTTVSA